VTARFAPCFVCLVYFVVSPTAWFRLIGRERTQRAQRTGCHWGNDSSQPRNTQITRKSPCCLFCVRCVLWRLGAGCTGAVELRWQRNGGKRMKSAVADSPAPIRLSKFALMAWCLGTGLLAAKELRERKEPLAIWGRFFSTTRKNQGTLGLESSPTQ
jgi:hypothetical protein